VTFKHGGLSSGISSSEPQSCEGLVLSLSGDSQFNKFSQFISFHIQIDRSQTHQLPCGLPKITRSFPCIWATHISPDLFDLVTDGPPYYLSYYPRFHDNLLLLKRFDEEPVCSISISSAGDFLESEFAFQLYFIGRDLIVALRRWVASGWYVRGPSSVVWTRDGGRKEAG
jgi:hypothetical protein